MKQGIHPEYQEVVFVDTSTGKKFLCSSTVKSDETVEFKGKKYPCIKVSISSDSHPFFTGDQKFVDTEGRVDKFMKKYETKAPSKSEESDSEVKSGVAKKATSAKKSIAKDEAKKATSAKKSPVKDDAKKDSSVKKSVGKDKNS